MNNLYTLTRDIITKIFQEFTNIQNRISVVLKLDIKI